MAAIMYKKIDGTLRCCWSSHERYVHSAPTTKYVNDSLQLSMVRLNIKSTHGPVKYAINLNSMLLINQFNVHVIKNAVTFTKLPSLSLFMLILCNLAQEIDSILLRRTLISSIVSSVKVVDT